MQKEKRKSAGSPNRKELFVILGKIELVDNKKRFIPHSPKHLASALSRISVGKEVACTFSENIPTRSKNQLAYHYVLVSYIAEYTGHSVKEMHDFIMRVVFGEKQISIGGVKRMVRKSVADDAKMPKAEMSKLIESDLALCRKLNIQVPTAEELGYISNQKQYVDADHEIDYYPEWDGKTAFD